MVRRKSDDLVKIEETLLQVGLRIAKRGEGALFVVGKANYKLLVDQNVPPFKVIENPFDRHTVGNVNRLLFEGQLASTGFGCVVQPCAELFQLY